MALQLSLTNIGPIGNRLTGQELPAVPLRRALERLGLDGSVQLVEGVHHPLDVGLEINQMNRCKFVLSN